MVRFGQWILLLSVFFAATPRLHAASAKEARDFNAARMDFQLGFYIRAENGFAAFTTNYTDSAHLSEAILYQARARLQQSNYDGAISLLTGNQGSAGTNADNYLFWIGEANYRKSDYPAAANAFSNLAANYPASPRRLEAGVREATARARLSDWPGVVRLLGQTNGFFQIASSADATNDLVLRGKLLLSEAGFAMQNFTAAEAAIQPLERLALPADTDWQRLYLLCRIQLATGRTNEAFQATGRLLTLSTNAQQPGLLPLSVAFQAGLLEQMGRTNDAIAAYKRNLVAEAPPEQQRQALSKVTELSLAQNNNAGAAEVLKAFLTQFTNAPASDQALLALGEIRLRQYLAAQPATQPSLLSTNALFETNYLQSALESLDEFRKRFPHNPMSGEAELARGWCFWLQTNLPAAQSAFQAAVSALPHSTNQAIAYFKLADSQLGRRDTAGAISNYTAVIEKFGSLPEVVDRLFEPALYQLVQAGLAAGDLPTATNALSKLFLWYPDGFHTDSAMLLTGQQISEQGDPEAARKMFQDFVAAYPAADLLPQVRLAIARTYERQGLWTNAIEQYNLCLSESSNSVVRPDFEYYRAQATYKAGDPTNSLALFTNFVAQYPTNKLTSRAQMWVADYYFRAGSSIQAEASYKMVFRNTNNWSDPELTSRAQLMAARSAMERGAWGTAMEYVTNLYKFPDCPVDLKIQALFAYGDCFMSQDSTNKAADYKSAIGIYGYIYETYPTNRLASLAWGAQGNAYLQWIKTSSAYEDANKAFGQVLSATNAPLAARCQASVGLALILEKQAESAAATNQVTLLTNALNRCLEVFDNSILRDGEKPDLFWRKEAGLKAASFAERLELWPQAVRINEELRELVPAARARFDKNIARCKTHLSSVVAP